MKKAFVMATAAASRLGGARAEPEVFKQETPIAKLSPDVASKTLRVSPDGQRIAYMAKLDESGEAVFVNNEQSPKYGGIVNNSLAFSPDGRHFAYGAIFESSMSVIVDDVEMATGRSSIKDTLCFDGPRSLHAVRLDRDQLVREQIDLIGLPSPQKLKP